MISFKIIYSGDRLYVLALSQLNEQISANTKTAFFQLISASLKKAVLQPPLRFLSELLRWQLKEKGCTDIGF